jgi:SAM-dependent methyltransferase
MQRELINRAMQASLRQLEIRTVERFRCKEPLAMEISRQLKDAVPLFCSDNAKEQLFDFAKELKQWVDEQRDDLDSYLGPSSLSSTPNVVNKPQPHFTETIFATLIRCEVIATYSKYLKYLNIGCVLGGSLSYGKFFNIRQSLTVTDIHQQSDIDLLLIADLDKLDEELQKHNWDEIAEVTQQHKAKGNTEVLDTPLALILGLKPLIELASKIVHDEGLDNKNIVLSKKFKLNLKFNIGKLFYPEIESFPFLLSVHIISPQLYESLTNPLTIEEYKAHYSDKYPTIVEIRIDSEIRDVMVYGTMEGIVVPESIAKVGKEYKEYPFGYTKAKVILCRIPPYFYWEDRYVSGTYQNLIIPAFEVICDNVEKTIGLGITRFKHFLLQEGLREKAQFLDSTILLSKLHPRHPIFLQSIADSLDQIIDKQITSKTAEIISSYKVTQRLDIRRNFHAKYSADFNLHDEVVREINYYCGTDIERLNILELGSGSGELLGELRKIGYKGNLVGIDLVPVNPVQNRETSIDLIVGDINKLTELLFQHGYANERFDVILAIHVLYHINNVPLLLENITRWMSHDGVFITTANSNQNLHRLNRLFRNALFDIGYNFSPDRKYANFSAENATESLREYFKFVRHTVTETDIKITDKEDIVYYLESNYDNYEVPESIELRTRLTDYIRKSLNTLDQSYLIDRRIVSITSGKKQIRYMASSALLRSY